METKTKRVLLSSDGGGILWAEIPDRIGFKIGDYLVSFTCAYEVHEIIAELSIIPDGAEELKSMSAHSIIKKEDLLESAVRAIKGLSNRSLMYIYNMARLFEIEEFDEYMREEDE